MSFLENMAASAIGAVGNFFTGGASARKQYQYQSKLMDKQNQQQIDFWKMNNEYNTPFNQRARLEQAGLNPDLMYGGSGNMLLIKTQTSLIRVHVSTEKGIL